MHIKILILILIGINLQLCQSQFFDQGRAQSQQNQCRAAYTGKAGTCKRLSNCPLAQSYLQSYRIRPNICYFQGIEPIVCCEKQNRRSGSTQTSPKTGTRVGGTSRISDKKCSEEYSPKALASGVIHTTIVGGTKADPGEFSFMAALGWRRRDGQVDYNCGSFLISRTFALTSAHCTTLGGRSPDVVKVGGNTLTGPNASGLDIDISGIYVYPHYNDLYNYHDIALLGLSAYANQKPACIWSNSKFNYREVTAIGYGHTQFAGASSPHLLKVNLALYNNQVCQGYYPKTSNLPNSIVNTQICAGSKGKDTCQGDSGGPILIKANLNKKLVPYVIGITSFGQICAGSVPGVYTKITPYLDWIESIVWANQRG